MKCTMILQQYYLPERANEERFVSTFDDETTRAIPAITATSKFDNVQHTKENQP